MTARTPPVGVDAGAVQVDDVEMPVLLRQYLKLQARVIGFNVDPAFSHALDALVVVDLTQVSVPVLGRYMGREQAHDYLTYHRLKGSQIATETPCRRSA